MNLPIPSSQRALLNEEERWRELVPLASAQALSAVPYALARSMEILPLALIVEGAADRERRILTLLSTRELTADEHRSLRFAASAEVAAETIEIPNLTFAIEACYRGSALALSRSVQAIAKEQGGLHPATEVTDLVGDRPIPALLASLIRRGFAAGASDIHIEPEERRVRVRFRIHGQLCEEAGITLTHSAAEQLTRRIKVIAEIDLLITGRPTEGSFQFSELAVPVAVRVSTIPVIHGEKLVLRLLPLGSDRKSQTFDSLGLTPPQIERLRFALSAETGAIFLSGPTGSGKTTLLYTALEYLRRPWRNIVTLEDPVERHLAGINQTAVDRDRGLGYPQLLPPLLRQDPDVIMIGEIRDSETALTALTAAITGHLVLSTVHASNAFEILLRLRQLVTDQQLLLTPLRLLVSQRLLPLNCSACAEPIRPSERFRTFLRTEASTVLRQSSGCSRCAQSGTTGRIGVFELLPMTPELKRQLECGANEHELHELAKHSGYSPFQVQVRELLLRGLLAPKAALRVFGIPEEIL